MKNKKNYIEYENLKIRFKGNMVYWDNKTGWVCLGHNKYCKVIKLFKHPLYHNIVSAIISVNGKIDDLAQYDIYNIGLDNLLYVIYRGCKHEKRKGNNVRKDV